MLLLDYLTYCLKNALWCTSTTTHGSMKTYGVLLNSDSVPYFPVIQLFSNYTETGSIEKEKFARLIIISQKYVNNLKRSNPKHWWREVKHISGMTSSPALQNYIQIEILDYLPMSDLANPINNAFLEPMQELDPFIPIDPQVNSVSDQPHDITKPWEAYRKLKSLNYSKASGPDATRISLKRNSPKFWHAQFLS